MTGKIVPFPWDIFCDLSHVSILGILKKQLFLTIYYNILIACSYLRISLSSANRFWIPVAQNDGKFVFFRVVMFLWSFPRQQSALSKKTRSQSQTLMEGDSVPPFNEKHFPKNKNSFINGPFGPPPLVFLVLSNTLKILHRSYTPNFFSSSSKK